MGGKMKKMQVVLVLLGAAMAAPLAAVASDLSTSEGQLEAYVRMRGDLTGKEVVVDWQATIFAVLPGEKARPILKTYGFNISRMEKQADGGYHWISREVSYYQDVKTGKLIDKWTNPYTGEVVDVVQVTNDPVNFKFPSPKTYQHQFPWLQHGAVTSMLMDVPLMYPNPLQPDAFPQQSTGVTYLASEHFGFFVNTRDLMDDKLTSVPTHYNWFRSGPWLPWMNMGGKPGYLIYSGAGSKLDKWEDVPADVRDYTMRHYPLYRHAPAEYVTPNMTSWLFYKQLKQAEKK